MARIGLSSPINILPIVKDPYHSWLLVRPTRSLSCAWLHSFNQYSFHKARAKHLASSSYAVATRVYGEIHKILVLTLSCSYSWGNCATRSSSRIQSPYLYLFPALQHAKTSCFKTTRVLPLWRSSCNLRFLRWVEQRWAYLQPMGRASFTEPPLKVITWLRGVSSACS